MRLSPSLFFLTSLPCSFSNSLTLARSLALKKNLAQSPPYFAISAILTGVDYSSPIPYQQRRIYFFSI